MLRENIQVQQKDNFDIYLPNWLAKYNKLIYTIIFIIIVVILLYRLSQTRKQKSAQNVLLVLLALLGLGAIAGGGVLIISPTGKN